MAAGPGWVILGAWKQWAGAFFTAIAVKAGVDIAKANEPIHMYIEGFKAIFPNPVLFMALATFFVILSQVKINVTNAYSGSLSWSNFFSRLTHAHPGRVVWLVFHLIIALVLQELGVFDVLLWVLGFYSNVAIASRIQPTCQLPWLFGVCQSDLFSPYCPIIWLFETKNRKSRTSISPTRSRTQTIKSQIP
jgi:purine-cytosine permease-like protein